MKEPHTIWYHGTTADKADAIRKDGFRAGTYFGADLADAVEFGGDHIFEVPFPSSWTSESGWQMTITEPVPPEAIVAHYRFTKEVLYENEALRQRVFQSNDPRPSEPKPTCAWCESELLPSDDKHHYDGLVYCSQKHRAEHVCSTGTGKGRARTIGTGETFVGVGPMANGLTTSERQVLCMEHGGLCPEELGWALERLWLAVLVWPSPQARTVLHTPLGRRVRELLLARETLTDSDCRRLIMSRGDT